MSTTELIDLIETLPADQKKQIEALVFELTNSGNKNGLALDNNAEAGKKQPMKFGDLKGFVKYISDDFDEPLDEFKDYM